MRKFKLLSLLLSGIIFIAVSCTKEGPEGPVGATGAQGPAGVAGPVGPAGPSGATSTYSDWYTTVAADWVNTGVAPYKASFLVNRTAVAITQAIMDRGIILGFVSGWAIDGAVLTRSTDVGQMPYLADLDFMDYYDFVAPSAGNIRYLYKSNLAWGPAQLAGTKLRYIVISGGLPGGRGVDGSIGADTFNGYTAQQIKAMSYAEVVAAFNIPAAGTNIR